MGFFPKKANNGKSSMIVSKNFPGNVSQSSLSLDHVIELISSTLQNLCNEISVLNTTNDVGTSQFESWDLVDV